MIKVIPAITQCYCDACGKQVTHETINCKGKASFVGRDLHGHAVGGNSIDYDLCVACTEKLREFLAGGQ